MQSMLLRIWKILCGALDDAVGPFEEPVALRKGALGVFTSAARHFIPLAAGPGIHKILGKVTEKVTSPFVSDSSSKT